MSQIVRPLVAAARLASCLVAAALPTALASPAVAQAVAPKKAPQIELTQKQIDGWMAAQASIRALAPKSGDPDPKLQAKLESIVKTNGFSSLDDYEAVSENVAMVIVGVEPGKGTYIGSDAMIKKQIAEIEANASMKPAEKAAALEEAKAALAAAQAAPPTPGNIAIVTKNYGKLLQAISGN